MAKSYRSRFGQIVTDPDAVEARRVVTQMRRLITLGVKAGRPWDKATTIGDVAKATKKTAEQILEIIRRYGDAWFLGISEDSSADIGAWTVYQDGE